MSYKSTHTGAQIDAGVTKALNPDATLSQTGELADAKAVGDALGDKAAKAVYLTYGSTSMVEYNAAVAAYNAGGAIFVRYGGIAIPLAYVEAQGSGYKFHFSGMIYDYGVQYANNAVLYIENLQPVWSGFGELELAVKDTTEQMILASFPTDSISNAAVASFPDGADGIPVKALTVNITPVQSGSGDPSPTNVRPISGWTGAQIVVSPTLDAQDGTTYSVSWQSEAGTVYGGTLTDNGDGTWTLTVQWKSVDLGTLNWTKGIDSPPNYFSTEISDSIIGVSPTNYLCSHYPAVSFVNFYGNHQDKCCSGYTGNLFLVRDSDFSAYSANEFKTAMSGVQLVYRLKSAYEQTYTITAESVKTLLGDNNIFADCGSIASLTYRADVGLYIAKLLAEAAG